MIGIGSVVMKIAGRDAGMKGVVIEVVDKTYVLIDGQVRRKKCNILHLEPTGATLDIKKGASHDSVVKALKELGIESVERKKREQKEKPTKQRKNDSATPSEKKGTEKSAAKEKKPSAKKAAKVSA